MADITIPRTSSQDTFSSASSVGSVSEGAGCSSSSASSNRRGGKKKSRTAYMHNPYAGTAATISVPLTAQQSTKPPKKNKKKKPLCLDYLQGECSSKRSNCSYYHPDVTQFPPGVCWAYYATGFCKYGRKCKQEHPAEFSGCCGIALTKGMTQDQRKNGLQTKHKLKELQPATTVCAEFRQTVKLWAQDPTGQMKTTNEEQSQPQLLKIMSNSTNRTVLTSEIVSLVLENQFFASIIPQVILAYVDSQAFPTFCEAVLVCVVEHLKPEIHRCQHLLALLWEMYQCNCGSHSTHAETLKLMLTDSELVEYLISLIGSMDVKHKQNPNFNSWQNLFNSVLNDLYTQTSGIGIPIPIPHCMVPQRYQMFVQ